MIPKNRYLNLMKDDFSYECLLAIYDYMHLTNSNPKFRRSTLIATYQEYTSLDELNTDLSTAYETLEEIDVLFSFDGGFVTYKETL